MAFLLERVQVFFAWHFCVRGDLREAPTVGTVVRFAIKRCFPRAVVKFKPEIKPIMKFNPGFCAVICGVKY